MVYTLKRGGKRGDFRAQLFERGRRPFSSEIAMGRRPIAIGKIIQSLPLSIRGDFDSIALYRGGGHYTFELAPLAAAPVGAAACNLLLVHSLPARHHAGLMPIFASL